MGLLQPPDSSSSRGQFEIVWVQKNRFDKLLAHDRRRRFDPSLPAFLPHLQCKHRNRSAIHPFYWKCNRLRRRARADYIQERQVVVWRRYRQIGFGAELILVIDQRGVILGEEQFADSVLKRICPAIRLWGMPSPCIGMQVVHDIAATKNENAFFS
jgi:hypothetical protein